MCLGVSLPRLSPFVCTLRSTTLGRPLKCGAAACIRAGIAISPPQYHTPSSVRQQRFNSTSSITHPHIIIYHTPNTRCECSDVLSHPLFITPPHTPCGCPDVVSHPVVYITPLASGTFITGPQDTYHTGDNVFKAQNVITEVCYLVSYGVYGIDTNLCCQHVQIPECIAHEVQTLATKQPNT